MMEEGVDFKGQSETSPQITRRFHGKGQSQVPDTQMTLAL